MYIGLLEGSHEPSPSTGYARVEGDLEQGAIFPASKGYGEITHLALFEAETGGALLQTVELPAPVDVHAGVIPIVRAGQLLRGLDVTSQIKVSAAGNMKL